MAVGYPACAVMCYAIFSKILGPFPQASVIVLYLITVFPQRPVRGGFETIADGARIVDQIQFLIRKYQYSCTVQLAICTMLGQNVWQCPYQVEKI